MSFEAPLPVRFRSITIEKISLPLLFLILSITFGFGAIQLEGVEKILPITTFLYGLIATFILGDRYRRYESIHDTHSKEAGDLISLYFMARLIGKDFSKKMRDAIDNYIVGREDFFVEDSVEFTGNAFYKIFEVIKKHYSKMKSSEAGGQILSLFENISELRKEMNVNLKDKLTIVNWFIIFALAVILLISIQAIKTDSLVFNFIVFLFSFIVVLIPFLIRDLDNLMWGGYARGAEVEVYQRVLDRMGSLRYYPAPVLNKLVVPPEGKDYRVGIFLKPYPDNTKEIKIVKASKSKSL